MHTVIVGGGFAGVKAALELSKKQLGKITLISDEPYFLHHATLYATATGRNASASAIALEDVFAAHHDVKIIHSKMKAIDQARRLVVCETQDIYYDSLILALGSVTNYFGTKGMAQFSYGIKTLSEVQKLRQHLHDEVTKNQHGHNAYYVIGAGPSGVELAGAIAEYIKEVAAAHGVTRGETSVVLVEAAPRILPRLSKTASRKVGARLRQLGVTIQTGNKVESLSKASLTVNSKKVSTHTVIWTSGAKNNPFFAAHPDQFVLSKNGRVEVNRYLEAAEDIYVLGDNANTPYAGRAYTALQDATFIAEHLVKKTSGKLLSPYIPHRVSQSVPVGHNWAYVEKYGIYVAGRAGFWLRRLIELWGLKALLPYNQAISAWHAYDQTDTSCELCKTKRPRG